MKIVRAGSSSSEVQTLDLLRADGDDVVLVLEDAFDEHEAHRYQFDTIFFEQVGRDDGVGNPGLIFQTEKDEPVSRAGALAGDHASGGLHPYAIRRSFQLDRRQHALLTKLGALVRHGMLTDGEAGAGIVGDETLFGVHLRERRSGIWLRDVVEQRADGLGSFRDLPESVATMEVLSAEW